MGLLLDFVEPAVLPGRVSSLWLQRAPEYGVLAVCSFFHLPQESKQCLPKVDWASAKVLALLSPAAAVLLVAALTLLPCAGHWVRAHSMRQAGLHRIVCLH